MIHERRATFNKHFSEKAYTDFLAKLKDTIGLETSFRVAETPVFLPEDLVQKLVTYSKELIEFSCKPEIQAQTRKDIPEQWNVPRQNDIPHFVCVDFGISENEDGTLEPKLIEIQGFPSLFAFQLALYDAWSKEMNLDGLTPFFEMDRSAYTAFLKKMFCHPNTIVLEIEPEKQNTYVDLFLIEKMFGTKVLCVTQIRKKGNKLFYEENGQLQPIDRIINRVIFDELVQRDDLSLDFSFKDDLDVSWLTHPNWFYSISKSILPLMDFPYVPKSYLLEDLKTIPTNLESYVLKPLFSFSGAGVLIDVTEEDLKAIKNPSNYMLQEKVEYAPLVQSTNGKVKLEVRIMAARTDDMPMPVPVTNVVRLTRGKMVGVKYNKNMDWVGGSIGLFER